MYGYVYGYKKRSGPKMARAVSVFQMLSALLAQRITSFPDKRFFVETPVNVRSSIINILSGGSTQDFPL